MKIYFISDQHFNHLNVIKYCNRPYLTVEEMNNSLIKNHNQIVKKTDIVYMLGDFCFGNKEKIKEFVSQLNGRKMLICGNHDGYKPTDYIKLGFEWASRFPIIYDKFFILSHEPVFLESNSPYACIYGHTHQNNYIGPNNNYFNVSVEQINYTPISFDLIKKQLMNKS